MVVIRFNNGDPELEISGATNGFDILRIAIENRTQCHDECDKNTLNHAIIEGITFEKDTYICDFVDVTFNNCKFEHARFQYSAFRGCNGSGNIFVYDEDEDIAWISRSGLKGKTMTKKAPPILKPTNQEIEERFGVKVSALPNKSFVKIKWTCAFCHRDFTAIARRDRVERVLQDRKDVPNCAKKVCEKCFNSYKLSEKFYGHRHYGYSGAVAKHTTDMDAKNTVLIGLEMEFEGDFTGWKELEDAHKGQLHYGYDSSVIGQNELSWDCGSYSWWKYLSSLKDVCDVIKNNNGHAGDSAGIHIHISRPDTDIYGVTKAINIACRKGLWHAIMKSVSLRNNLEKFERYASLTTSEDAHHAGISFNGHGTCEFRVFNSSTDATLILKQMKFCKEVYNLFADGESNPDKLSKETLLLIKNCAKIQHDKGFINDSEYNLITTKIK